MSRYVMKSTSKGSGFLSCVLRFLFPIALMMAAYSLGAYTEARTVREQTIELGTSGYDTKTAQWSLYDAQTICQDYVSSMHSQDDVLLRAAQEDQALQSMQPVSQPPKLPVGIFIKAGKAGKK